MFRAENVQRGRLRQFHQAGCEIFGDAGPASDAEMIDMLHRFYRDLGIADASVLVNSLGDSSARERYREALRQHLLPRQAELSEASQRRLNDNPLRILDSKNPRDQELVRDAPNIVELLSDEDRAHFDGLRRHLDALGVPYRVEPRLVRGLDYYTRTLFEIQSSAGNMGAQNALCGGGRYDAMIRELGGPSVPAIGFALGLERLFLALGESPVAAAPPCFIAPIGERATTEGLVLARDLRERGVVVDVDGRGNSMKSMLRRANGVGARFCVILGDAELERGVVKLKDLTGHAEEELPRATAVDTIVARVSGTPSAPSEEPR
jgi:histidyl-tRNA synthetase